MQYILFLLLLIFTLTNSQLSLWQPYSKTLLIQANTTIDLNTAPNVKTIKYTVVCTEPCDILLMTESEFHKMTKHENFTTLRSRINVDSDSHSETFPKHPGVLKLVIRNPHLEDIGASVNMDQEMPLRQATVLEDSMTLLLFGLGGGFAGLILILCCFLK